jgi:hypothetical protein
MGIAEFIIGPAEGRARRRPQDRGADFAPLTNPLHEMKTS